MVGLPASGESIPVLLGDVLDRKVWFPEVGIYIMRSGSEVTYVGLTSKPLRLRLLGSIYSKTSWTRAEGYRGWTITVQRAPDYPDDHLLEMALVAELRPRFNTYGRPKKPLTKHCECRGICPDCGQPRGGDDDLFPVS